MLIIEILFAVFVVIAVVILAWLVSHVVGGRMAFIIALVVIGVVILAMFAEASIASAEQFMQQFGGAL